MIKFSLLFLTAGILAAQPFTIGIKGGAKLTNDLDSFFATSESKRYAIGPSVTARLPFGFRLEFDALYRRAGFSTSSGDSFGGSYTERDTGNSWEFPILVRRTLWHGIYAGAGYAPRAINGSAHAQSISVTSLNPLIKTYSDFKLPGPWDTTHGIVGAAGIEKRIGPLHIGPELRYAHWNKPAVNEYGSHGFAIQSKLDQFDLLIGIRFP